MPFTSLTAHLFLLRNDQTLSGFDCVLTAIGRHPRTAGLNLSAAGVLVTPKEGYVQVRA